MKKTLSIILAMLLILTFSTGTVLAKPGNGKSGAKSGVVTTDTSGTVKANAHVNAELKKSLREQKTLVKQEQKIARFSDINGHWAAAAIENLTAIGVFSGYPDGTFQPDDAVTQAEAISLIMTVAGDETEDDATAEEELGTAEADEQETDEEIDEDAEEDTEEEPAEEVPGWAQKSVFKAAVKGVVNMNRFHSSVQASRAQVAVWIAQSLEIEPADCTEVPFTDESLISQEDLGYIMALQQEGILQGSADGSFNPNNAITRAEMAVIIDRLLTEEEVAAGDTTADGSELTDESEDDGTAADEDTNDGESTGDESE